MFLQKDFFNRSEVQIAVIVPIKVFPDNGVIEQIAELISEQEALDTLQLLYLTVFVIQVLSNDHIWALEYIVFSSLSVVSVFTPVLVSDNSGSVP